MINTFANKWGVDRKAVAGIIMWEALENPSKIQVWGVGKFHFTEPTKPFTESLAEQLEKRGYLPSQSLLDRREILRSTNGFLDYAGAAMKAFTDIYKSAGIDISKDPAVLGTLYNAYNLDSAEQNLLKIFRRKIINRVQEIQWAHGYLETYRTVEEGFATTKSNTPIPTTETINPFALDSPAKITKRYSLDPSLTLKKPTNPYAPDTETKITKRYSLDPSLTLKKPTNPYALDSPAKITKRYSLDPSLTLKKPTNPYAPDTETKITKRYSLDPSLTLKKPTNPFALDSPAKTTKSYPPIPKTYTINPFAADQ